MLLIVNIPGWTIIERVERVERVAARTRPELEQIYEEENRGSTRAGEQTAKGERESGGRRSGCSRTARFFLGVA